MHANSNITMAIECCRKQVGYDLLLQRKLLFLGNKLSTARPVSSLNWINILLLKYCAKRPTLQRQIQTLQLGLQLGLIPPYIQPIATSTVLSCSVLVHESLWTLTFFVCIILHFNCKSTLTEYISFLWIVDERDVACGIWPQAGIKPISVHRLYV